jgi:hypothetical protein
MFKLGAAPAETPSIKQKKPDQEPLIKRNNLQQTTKKEYVENAVKTAFDVPPQQSKNANDDDFLDRHLIGKANLDYIPGLDFDLGPVFIPCRHLFIEMKDFLYLDFF